MAGIVACGAWIHRFGQYMEYKIELAERDVKRFQGDEARRHVAEYWLSRFQRHYYAYRHDFYRDILGTLKWLQDEGIIEVLTSAATHGFLPLMERDSSEFAQVRVGIDTYRKYFGRNPRGFWLPECGYRPAQWSHQEKRLRKGIDEWLAAEGIEYFFVENVGLTRGEFVENRYAESAPTTDSGYLLPSGVAVFGRNEATGRQAAIVTPPPGPRSRALAAELARVEAAGVNTLGAAGEPAVVWQEALGANVLDVDGNRYVDLTAGFGVAAVGHRHPAVVAAVARQAGELVHGLGDVAAHPARVALAANLAALATVDEARVHFAEILQLKGWMLLLQGDLEGAAKNYLASLDWGREQQAKSWELRTSTSLATVAASGQAQGSAMLKAIRSVSERSLCWLCARAKRPGLEFA